MGALKHMVIRFEGTARGTIRGIVWIAAMNNFATGKKEVHKLNYKMDEIRVGPTKGAENSPVDEDGVIKRHSGVYVIFNVGMVCEMADVVSKVSCDGSVFNVKKALACRERTERQERASE